MNREATIKLIESMEANAHRLLNDIATLKAELSGGSDSSKSQVFSNKHKQEIISRRDKYRYKKTALEENNHLRQKLKKHIDKAKSKNSKS